MTMKATTNRLLTSLVAANMALGGCAVTSQVQERVDGTYLISGRAAQIRGGTVGAQDVAYKDALKFCADKGQRALIVESMERDISQSSFGFNAYGGGGGTAVSGAVTLNFRCQ
jgi:hypothetical protein